MKFSSRNACFLLWLFIVHSIQGPAATSNKERSEQAEGKGAATSDSPEQNINAVGAQDATNVALSNVAQASKSKEHVESGKNAETSSATGISTKGSIKATESTVSSQAHDTLDHDHQDRVQSSGNKRVGDNIGQNAQKPDTKQLVATVVEGQKSAAEHPASSGSDKSTDNAGTAVDAKKQDPGENNARKHSGPEKSSVKSTVAAVVTTSEVTTLTQEKTLTATTSKPAEPAHTVTSEHPEILPSTQFQGPVVEKKYTGALPDVPKDLGGMPSATSGNIEYGHVKEPDSEEDLDSPIPTQKNPTFVDGASAQLGAQPVVGSVGGSRPEKPLDASAAAGSMPLLPAQDDSHFFAYFLTAVVLCVVAYLAFHNKRKILALILEGRHERQRRHNGHYRRLDNVDDVSAVRKGRGSF